MGNNKDRKYMLSPESKIGRLTLIGEISRPGYANNSRLYVECKCDCGKKVIIQHRSLTKKNPTKSCGCIPRELASRNFTGYNIKKNTKHGKFKSPEWRSWRSMIQRCYESSNASYKNYGGRGIKVCDRWRRSFPNFLEDMGEKPTPQHSIDRKDNYGNYSLSNCRWATDAEQRSNRRRRHR